MLKLNKKHEYSIGKQKVRGVTTFIHSFFEEFDAKSIAKKLSTFPVNKANKRGVRYWLKKWSDTRKEGTLIHRKIESFIKDGKLPEHTKALSAIKFMSTYKDVIFDTEVMIYSPEYNLAGTVDCIMRTPEGIWIIDWKSNEKIEKTAYKNKKGILPPTSNIPDSNYWHYCLQLNMYAYILKDTEKILGMKLVQLKDKEYSIYEVPVMFDVIGEMIKYEHPDNVSNKVL